MERYRFILAEEAHFSVVPMCRLLGVSRSGYNGWRERGDSDRNARTASFDAEVRAAHLKSQMRYGSRRVQRELHEIGLGCSRTRVACAMGRCGLVARARRRFRPQRTRIISARLRQTSFPEPFMPAARIRLGWATSATSVRVRAGSILRSSSTCVPAASSAGPCRSKIDRHLVRGALRMAISTRRPAAGLLHYTDRGSQYASRDYRQAL